MGNPYDEDRPEGYNEARDSEPAIRPKRLVPNEKLAVDAEDVEEFIEHFGQDDGPIGSDLSA